jgi:hypothetical protein
MKRRMGRAFTDGQMAAPTEIGLGLRKSSWVEEPAVDRLSRLKQRSLLPIPLKHVVRSVF